MRDPSFRTQMKKKTYCGDIYHVPVTIAGRDAWGPLEKVTDGRPIYFPATDGLNVRIDGPARWTQRPEQRFTVSLIPLLQLAAECQPIQDSALAGIVGV
jgi:hypothetical protein